MRKKLALLIAVAACLSAATALGCASQNKSLSVTEPATQTVSEGTRIADWEELYPLQVASFYSDYNLVKPDGRVHGHSNLINKITLRHGPVRPALASCMYCKTGQMTEFYEKYGDESFAMPYFAAEGGIEKDIEMWNCVTCHSDQSNPAGSLGASLVFWEELSGEFGEGISEKNAACGQCHNALEPYRYLVGATGSLSDFDAYKYGASPDGWMKALYGAANKKNYSDEVVVEDAIAKLDQESGILGIGVYHPDIEMFQNSSHQSLGLSCTDCHMTQETTIDGEPYTRHAASLSPLASKTTLEYCLTCHESQGIENTEQMVKWVKEKQNAIKFSEDELVSKMETLYELILEGTKSGDVSEELLEQARTAHTNGELYYKWQRGSAINPGIKVAMYNSDSMLQCINKGIQEVDTGIALFGQQ